MPGFLRILAALFFFLANLTFAQNTLRVENKNTNEKYTIEQGDYIKILYTGYLKQFAEQKSHVELISDQTILFNSSKSPMLIDDDRNVRIEDIKGIKKLWKYEKIARPVITLGATLGSYFYFGSGDFSTNEQVVYSALVSIGTNLLLNLIFNDTIEHKVSNGWTIQFSAAQP